MMASVILVVGFIGLIDAVALSSNMMNQARRQTAASQIINHELEKLRLLNWSKISELTTTSTAVAVDREFWPAWDGAMTYRINNVVAHNGAWYRCIAAHNNQAPPNATYWSEATSAQPTDIVFLFGATFSITRTVTNPDPPVTNVLEVNFTAEWKVNTGRRDASGSPVVFTYRRANCGWFGKYGLNLTYQRS